MIDPYELEKLDSSLGPLQEKMRESIETIETMTEALTSLIARCIDTFETINLAHQQLSESRYRR
jgi:hypothetical protein